MSKTEKLYFSFISLFPLSNFCFEFWTFLDNIIDLGKEKKIRREKILFFITSWYSKSQKIVHIRS